jgi:hypothetical protein
VFIFDDEDALHSSRVHARVSLNLDRDTDVASNGAPVITRRVCVELKRNRLLDQCSA